MTLKIRSLLLEASVLLVCYWILFHGALFQFGDLKTGWDHLSIYSPKEFWKILHGPPRTFPGTFPKDLTPIIDFLIQLNEPVLFSKSMGFSGDTQRIITAAWPHAIPTSGAHIRVVIQKDLENTEYKSCNVLFNHKEISIVRC